MSHRFGQQGPHCTDELKEPPLRPAAGLRTPRGHWRAPRPSQRVVVEFDYGTSDYVPCIASAQRHDFWLGPRATSEHQT